MLFEFTNELSIVSLSTSMVDRAKRVLDAQERPALVKVKIFDASNALQCVSMIRA
jgi:hypothetical protein